MRNDDRSDSLPLNQLKFHNKMASSLSNFLLDREFPLSVNLEDAFLRTSLRAEDKSSAFRGKSYSWKKADHAVTMVTIFKHDVLLLSGSWGTANLTTRLPLIPDNIRQPIKLSIKERHQWAILLLIGFDRSITERH